jgi:hypothetical protein
MANLSVKVMTPGTSCGAIRATETAIRGLYLTDDIIEGDQLTFQMRRFTPQVLLDVFPGCDLKRLRSEDYAVALIDCRGSRTTLAALSTYLFDDHRPLATVVVLPDNEKDATLRKLKAGADGYVIRRREFFNELPTVVRDALSRHENRVRRANKPSPPPAVYAQEVREAPEKFVQTRACPQHVPSDKRGAQRVKVHLPCRLEWQSHSQPAIVHDLSETGGFFETPTPPPVGTMVDIRIKAGSVELLLSGRVMHHGWFMTDIRNFYGFGARFMDLTDQGVASLKKLLNAHPLPAPRKTVLLP